MNHLSLWSRDHPIVVISILIAISAFFAYHARTVQVNPSTTALRIEDEHALPFYQNALKTFGSDQLTVIYIEDAALFTHEKLSAVEAVYYNLRKVPGVRRVDGLFSVTHIKDEDGSLTIGPLLEEVPQSPSALAQIRVDALRNPFLNRTLVSHNKPAIALTVTVDAESLEPNFDIRVANDIDSVIAPLKGKVDEVFQVGVSMTRRFLNDTIQRDIQTITPLSMLIVLVVFSVGVRSLTGAMLPIITGGLSGLWTIGFMAAVGIPINILTWFVPVLILVVGSTEDMHLFSEYLTGLEGGKNRMQAIAQMAEKAELAVILTGLTTFLGFLAIVLNKIPLLQQFGQAAAFGLFVNPFVTLTCVPVYLRFFGPKKVHRAADSSGNIRLSRVADRMLSWMTRHSRWILGGLVAATLLMGGGALLLKVDNDFIGYFRKNSEIRVRSEKLHQVLSGAQNFYLVLEAERREAFKRSENLEAIDEIQQFIAESPYFDTSLSLADGIAFIHREMAGAEQAGQRIPDEDALIAQYLLLFPQDDLERYVSTDFRRANIHVRHHLSSSHDLKNALNGLESAIEGIVGRRLAFEFTGDGILMSRAADTIALGQVYSLGLILVCIFIILAILFVRIKAGVLALVPNLVPIVFLFGIMGFLHIPLNPGTAMVAACVIGIAVDDTIHLFVRYHAEMKRFNEAKPAIVETVHSNLRPVTITSVGLAVGLGALGFSNLVPSAQFGLLASAVLVCAFFADLLVTPVLLSMTKLITLWELLGLHLTENVIEKSELFRAMSRTQIKKVVLMGNVNTWEADEYIIRQGDRDRRMYIILEGTAKVVINAEDGTSIAVADLSEGDVFGEIGLVDEVERTANVLATQPTRVLAIDWNSLERIRRIYPRISTRFFLNISRILGARLSETNDLLLNTHQQNPGFGDS